MREEEGSLIDQAIAWHLRQAHMGSGDWHDFVDWLETSPAHAEVYDRIATADRQLVRPEAFAVPANDDRPSRRRLWYGAGAVAAGIAAALMLVPMLRAPASEPYLVQTGPGQRQTVRLADGSRIDLGGGSRLRLDRADSRTATLEAGEAVFTVRHDPGHPYVLRSGSSTIRDLGTVFDVARAGPRLDVQVSEGSVMFDPDGQAIRVVAGEALVVSDDARRIRRTHVPVEAVGGWRTGLLRFEGEPLPVVAARIRDLFGTRVVLEGDLPARDFTGIIQFTGVASRDIPHLAALVGAGWRRNGEQWILEPRGAAPR